LLRHRAEEQTDTQTNRGENPTPVTAVGVVNKFILSDFLSQTPS